MWLEGFGCDIEKFECVRRDGLRMRVCAYMSLDCLRVRVCEIGGF